jgi:hypothetical protein
MAAGGGGGGSSSGAIRAGRAFVEIFVKNQVGEGLKAVQSSLKGAGNMLLGGGAALGAAGLAGYGVLDAFDSKATERGAMFAKLADRLGDTTEALSQFQYAAEAAGLPLGQLDDLYENWPSRVRDAAKGVGPMVEVFESLKLDAQQLAQMPFTESLIKFLGALGKSKGDIASLAALGDAFSDKGQGLRGLSKLGEAGIRKKMSEGDRLGTTVSTQDATQAREIEAAYFEVETAVKAVAYQIGLALMPSKEFMNTFVTGAREAAIQIRELVKENGPLIQKIELGVYATIALGGAAIAAGAGMHLLSAATSSLLLPLTALKAGYSVLAPIVTGSVAIMTSAWASFAALKLTTLAAISSSWTGFTAIYTAGRAILVAGSAIASIAATSTAAAWVAGSAASAGAWIASTSIFATMSATVLAGYAAMKAGSTASMTWAGAWAAVQAAASATAAAAAIAYSSAVVGSYAVAAAAASSWQTIRAGLLAFDAAIVAAYDGMLAGLKAAWVGTIAASAAAWAATKAASVSFLLGVEAVTVAVVAWKSLWTASVLAASAAWTGFVALYRGGTAAVMAIGGAMGAMKAGLAAAWSIGSAAMSAAWVGFQSVWIIGQSLIIGGIALLKAAILVLPLALAGLAIYWVGFSESGKAAIGDLTSSMSSWFGAAKDSILASWGSISSAIGRGDFKSAFAIGIGTMKVEWARGVMFFTDYWNRFKSLFVDGWRNVALTFTNIWSSAVHGTAGLLVDLGEMVGIYSKQDAEGIRNVMNEDAAREKKARIDAAIKAAANADQARAADADAAAKDLIIAEKDLQFLRMKEMFRSAFAAAAKAGEDDAKGGKSDPGTLLTKGGGDQVTASFAGSVGATTFAPGMTELKQIAKEHRDLGKEQVALLTKLKEGFDKLDADRYAR